MLALSLTGFDPTREWLSVPTTSAFWGTLELVVLTASLPEPDPKPSTLRDLPRGGIIGKLLPADLAAHEMVGRLDGLGRRRTRGRSSN